MMGGLKSEEEKSSDSESDDESNRTKLEPRKKKFM